MRISLVILIVVVVSLAVFAGVTATINPGFGGETAPATINPGFGGDAD